MWREKEHIYLGCQPVPRPLALLAYNPPAAHSCGAKMCPFTQCPADPQDNLGDTAGGTWRAV